MLANYKRRKTETDFKYNGERKEFFKFTRELTTQLELSNSSYLLNPIRINEMTTAPIRAAFITRQTIPDAEHRKQLNGQETLDYNWKLENFRKESRRIEEDSTKAKAIIKSLLEDHILVKMNHITLPRMIHNNEYANFTIMYEHIQNTYLPRDPRFIDQIKREIQLLTDNNGMAQLVSDLDILQDILCISSPLDALRDTAIKTTFLNSIVSYGHDQQFQQLVTMCRETETISYSNTCTKLTNYMESHPTLKHQTTATPTFTAYTATQQQDTINNNVQTYYPNEIKKCYNCKLTGHTAKECKSKKCGLCQKLCSTLRDRVQHYYDTHRQYNNNNNKRKLSNDNNYSNHQNNNDNENDDNIEQDSNYQHPDYTNYLN